MASNSIARAPNVDRTDRRGDIETVTESDMTGARRSSLKDARSMPRCQRSHAQCVARKQGGEALGEMG